MDAQLELPFEEPSEVPGAADEAVALPSFALSEDRTPAEIRAWWDALVATFTCAAKEAEQKAAPLEAELAGLKGVRTATARQRARFLRTEREQLLARAEAVEFAAYAAFEGALAEFSPRLITLMQAAGLDVADDDEMAVANFWECLERPAIEYCAEQPLRELVRDFALAHS